MNGIIWTAAYLMRPPFRAVERIGRCDLCGEVDHHLIDAACPACRKKYALPESNHSSIATETSA